MDARSTDVYWEFYAREDVKAKSVLFLRFDSDRARCVGGYLCYYATMLSGRMRFSRGLLHFLPAMTPTFTLCSHEAAEYI